MRWARREATDRSLRFRLTFWNAAVLLLLAAATLLGVRAGLKYTLSRELDLLLDEDAREVKLVIERYYPNWGQITEVLERKALTHNERAWFGQVLAVNGAVLRSSTGTPEFQLPRKTAGREGTFTTGEFRLAQRRAEPPDGPPLLVQVGSALAFIQEDVDRLTEMMLIAGGCVLAAAPLVGYWLAGRATRPLATILETAARLRPDALAERLPLRGSGDELDRLSATINGLLDRLADHLGRQRDFVANAAHELRSPLAALRTSVEVALTHERTPAEYQELLVNLTEECSRLGQLVGQLLLLAEGDAGRLQPSRDASVRLDQLAEKAVDMFQGIAELRGLELHGDLRPASAWGNDTHLRQVLLNLIDNAIKFTPAGGRVIVAVAPSATPARVVLRVRDTGAGIPAHELPHVFDRFYRGDKSRQREYSTGGHGLGLSICQAIVSSLGGEIAVASSPGQGTTVTVFLRQTAGGEFTPRTAHG